MIDVTLDYMVENVPKNMKKIVSQGIVDEINRLSNDPDYGESFKEAVISTTKILDGTQPWSMRQYLDAIKYHGLMAMGSTRTDAYIKVFPERMQARLDRGETKADIGGEASRYNATELVNKIREQCTVPFYLVNAHVRQKAVDQLANLMITSRSDVAKVSAATALLKELAPPETSKIELDIGLNTTDSIADLRKATEELAMAQLQSIQAGVAVKQIAESTIVDTEVITDE